MGQGGEQYGRADKRIKLSMLTPHFFTCSLDRQVGVLGGLLNEHGPSQRDSSIIFFLSLEGPFLFSCLSLLPKIH